MGALFGIKKRIRLMFKAVFDYNQLQPRQRAVIFLWKIVSFDSNEFSPMLVRYNWGIRGGVSHGIPK